VVIDEIHAFVGDDRGGHLSAVLERLSRFCGRDVQRIGLSATVGNPPDILAWSAGSSKREGRVVDPGGARAKPELGLDFVGNDANAARIIGALHQGEKRLVFVDSRRRVEAIGKLLREHEVDVFVTHSSLSVGERQMAEEAFERGSSCVIVATSALELGIDIGDLDRVIQVDAPTTVAAFLQRMGRTGRRSETTPNCLFLATSDDSLVQAAAILRLHERGFVEPVPLQRRSAHLLAHQLMALSIQTGGIPRSDWWSWVSAATPFAGLAEADRAELLEHMLTEDILAEVGGQLVLGDAGEKRYGRRNFLELYAVFQTPRALRVLWGGQEIGTIDAFFAESEPAGNLSFVLGARSWRAVEIRWNDGFVVVEPVDRSQPPRWQGSTRLLGQELCQTMREILVGDDCPDIWSTRARERIEAIRAEYGFLDREPGLDLASDDNGYRLWTFAGGRANNLLGKVLESELGETITLDNRYIGFRDQAAKSSAAIADAIARLVETRRPSDEDALRFASLAAHRRLSKFQPCLTDRLEAIFLADELTDPTASRRALEGPLRLFGEGRP
jgi:ATP-dependent Lhr-like helicase